MIMMVDTELCPISFKEIIQELKVLSREINMEISIRSKDIFDAMHNI
jgi:predicted amino acid-binding ACT domain protein